MDEPGSQPADWTHVRALFEACLARPHEEREAELRAAPAHVAAEVRSLLAEVTSSGAGPVSRLLPEADPLERIGGYGIRGVLAAGGMGVVLLAEQREPRRSVALKILRADMPSADALRRFRDEAQILARLRHPGIAQVLEAGVHETAVAGVRLQRPWFAMELVEGARTLRQFTAEARPDRGTRLRIVLDICDAVQHGHLKGIIHRDLKPENVLIGPAGEVKLIDFGVARVLDTGPEAPAGATRTGDFVGTLGYCSPEQLSGDRFAIDTRSDVYSLGVVAFELLTGRLPYAGCEGGGVAVLAEAIRSGQTLRARRVAPDLPVDLDAILGKALEREPDRRYATAGAFGDDVRRFLRHDTVEARLPTVVYQLSKLARRHWVAVAATVVVVVTSLAAAIVASYHAERASDANAASQRNLASLLQLADQARLDDLRDEAASMPIVLGAAGIEPARRWIQRAERLAARLPELRRELQALRALGTPRPPSSDSTAARELAVAEAKLEIERNRVRVLESAETLGEERRADREARIWQFEIPVLRLRSRLAGNRPHEFAGDDHRSGEQMAWHHDALERLVVGIEEFVAELPSNPLNLGVHDATLPAVRARLACAELARAEQAHSAQRWAETREAIRASPRHGALDLPVQWGLVPLGADPDSGLQEFAWPVAGDVPERGADGRLVRSVDCAMVFVLLPGGVARVGDEQGPATGPLAVHEVRLDPFLLSKYEVTQAQWFRFFGTNDSFHHAGAPLIGETQVLRRSNPITNVSHGEAVRLLSRLGLELPTEVQWEYACRAGTRTRFWFGEDLAEVAACANFRDRAQRHRPATWDDGFYSHAPVGSLRANAFGLHDVLGNVSEWCRDGYYAYSAVPARDGDGLRNVDAAFVDRWAVRGGGFLEDPVPCAFRAHRADGETLIYAGVRPIWPLRQGD